MRKFREVPICERCGEVVVYNPLLGDLNAGPVHLVMGGYTVQLEDICADCMATLFEWMGGRRAPDSYASAIRGKEKMPYLPRLRPTGQPLLAPVKPTRLRN